MSSHNFTEKLVDLLTANKPGQGQGNAIFLNYDAKFISTNYQNEILPHPGILYSPIADFDGLKGKKFTTEQLPGIFDRTQNATREWQEQSDKVFAAFSKTGKANKNGQMIRPVSVDVKEDNIHFNVQKCGYFDQVATHLGLDYKEKPEDTSLREMLGKDYPGRLPPLEDGRLSNSFGVGMMLFYKEKGSFIPCVYKRTNDVAVFANRPNCTASGAVDWPEDNTVAMPDTVTARICTELKEETGLTGDEITNLQPVFIGRELARGGKMQLFYAATTEMPRDEIADRFKKNGRAARKAGVQEFELQLEQNKVDVLPSPEELSHFLGKAGMAPEGIANLYYSLPYLKQQP